LLVFSCHFSIHLFLNWFVVIDGVVWSKSPTPAPPMCSSITSTFWKCFFARVVCWRKFRCAESNRTRDRSIGVLFKKLPVVKKFYEKISFSEKKNFTVFQKKFYLTMYTLIMSRIGSWLFLFDYTFEKTHPCLSCSSSLLDA
jgi:hypothetical protein